MVLPNSHHVRFGPTKWADASADGYTVPRTIDVSGLCRSNPEEQDEEKWVWDSCPDDFGIDFNDLWYAVRGGGTWGVVTSLYLQLHEHASFEVYSVNPFPPSAVLQSPECTLLLPEGNCLLRWVPSGIKSLVGWMLAAGEVIKEMYPHMEGRASSQPPAQFVEAYDGANVLVPSAWIEESEENLQTLLSMTGAPYLAFGGVVRTTSDQANSLSSAHRDAAGGMFTFYFDELDYFWNELFPKMFDISDKSVFPPVFGGNHAGPLSSGPRKDDWTKACPPEWTLEERAEKCISVQEAVFGTTTLKRLEAIKEAVDPNYMFDCHRCIGNNRPKTKKPVEEEDNSGVVEVEGEGASVESTDENSGALLIGKSLSVIVVVVGWIGSQFMV